MFNKLREKLFGTVRGLERKQSREWGAMIQLGLETPIWTPADYERQILHGYQYNLDVYACVSLIAGAAKHIPWIVTRGEGGPAAAPGSREGQLLQLLQRPNKQMDGGTFIENAIAYKLLSGNLYIERSGGKEDEPPAFLYVPRPDRILVVKGSLRSIVAGYRMKGVAYTDPQRPYTWEPWEMLHLKSFNPLNDWYGMSPLEAAMRTVDTSNQAQDLYKRLLQKGYPPGAIIFESGKSPEGDVEIARFKAGIQRARSNEEILLLEGAQWKEMGFKPVDASIFIGRKMSKRDIASAFRVPPEMIGDAELKAYASAREARRGLYTEAVIPSILDLRNGLNAWLAPLYGNAFIDIDRDAIDALQEDREVVAKRVALLFKDAEIIKRNEARFELGYEAVPDDEDGYYSEVVKRPGPGETGDSLPVDDTDQIGSEDTGAAVGQRSALWRPERTAASSNLGLKAFNLVSEEQKTSYWQALEEERENWNVRIAREAGDRFKTESNLVIKAFRDGGQEAALSAVERQEKEWTRMYRSAYLTVSEHFGRQVVSSLKSQGYSELEFKFGEDVFTRTILEWLASEGAKRVTGISETTRDKIRKELSAGVSAGEGTFELSKRLQAMYSDFSIVRAERIARTEVISASNLGSQTAARATNLPLEKEWISALDQRTRDPHANAHGQRRTMDKPYTVMGESLMFPGDSSLGATSGNLVQCRCTESYRVKRG